MPESFLIGEDVTVIDERNPMEPDILRDLKTNYKFWYIHREDDVHITECAVRFYEGDTLEQDEVDPITGITSKVTRYRKTKRLNDSDLSHFTGRETKLETNGEQTFIFTEADFGVISTDAELYAYLDTEIVKDKNRTYYK